MKEPKRITDYPPEHRIGGLPCKVLLIMAVMASKALGNTFDTLAMAVLAAFQSSTPHETHAALYKGLIDSFLGGVPSPTPGLPTIKLTEENKGYPLGVMLLAGGDVPTITAISEEFDAPITFSPYDEEEQAQIVKHFEQSTTTQGEPQWN